jgi:hypothetical protein
VTRKSLLAAAMAYIKDAESRGAMEAAARGVRDEFLRVVRKTCVDEISRDDVFRFHEALRKRRCSDRTAANKHQRLTSWLRFAGIEIAGQGFQRKKQLSVWPPRRGLSPDHTRWISSSRRFFLPVKVLSRVFRGKFVAGLRRLVARRQLRGRVEMQVKGPALILFRV